MASCGYQRPVKATLTRIRFRAIVAWRIRSRDSDSDHYDLGQDPDQGARSHWLQSSQLQFSARGARAGLGGWGAFKELGRWLSHSGVLPSRASGCHQHPNHHSCRSRRLRGTSESGGLMPPAPQPHGPGGGYGAGPGGSAVAQDNRLGRRRRNRSRDRISKVTSKTPSLQSSMNLRWLIPTQRPSQDTARAQPRAAGITAGAAGDRPGPPGANRDAPPGPQASLAAGLRLGLKLFSCRVFQVAAT